MPSFMQIEYEGFFGGDRAGFQLIGTTFSPDGSDYTTVLGQQVALSAALAEIVNAKLYRFITGGNETVNDPAVPNVVYTDDGESYSKNKFIVTYLDTSNNRIYRQSMPFAQQSLFVPQTDPVTGNTNLILPPASTQYTALKAAWDAYVLSTRSGTPSAVEMKVIALA